MKLEKANFFHVLYIKFATCMSKTHIHHSNFVRFSKLWKEAKEKKYGNFPLWWFSKASMVQGRRKVWKSGGPSSCNSRSFEGKSGGTNLKKKVLLFFLPKLGGGGTIAPLPPGSDGPMAYRFNNERQTKFSLDRTKIDDRRQFFSPFVLLYRKDYM